MTATTSPSRFREPRAPRRLRRVAQWTAAAATLAVMPKCILCLLAYATIATGAAREVCGESPGSIASGFCTSLGWGAALVICLALGIGAVRKCAPATGRS